MSLLPCGCDPEEGASKLTRCDGWRRLVQLRNAVTETMDLCECLTVRSQLDRIRHTHVVALAAHLCRERAEVEA